MSRETRLLRRQVSQDLFPLRINTAGNNEVLIWVNERVAIFDFSPARFAARENIDGVKSPAINGNPESSTSLENVKL